MKLLDNISQTVKDDLAVSIKKGSKVSIAAACFSIYAFNELRKQLQKIDNLRFIFTSPTFIKENASKQKREFYIPKLNREKSIYGTEFEIHLRNELKQKAISKECAEWIKNKVVFKSNDGKGNMPAGFINVDNRAIDDELLAYMPVQEFTTAGIGTERGNNTYNMVNKFEEMPMSQQYLSIFDSIWDNPAMVDDVTDIVLESISNAYRENSPQYMYFVILYNIFHEFLEDISEDDLPQEATGYKDSKIWSMLYNFQKDAALGIISKMEKYNGCILADSVGLGKTFTALAVIKYYENKNRTVLVLCPKKLSENWNTYKGNYRNNPLVEDRLRYDVLYHTDLSRGKGYSNGINLELINWGNYDLVVIDESHNFRNGVTNIKHDHENRYLKLMNKVMKDGVKTKVLMLSATPVNNRFLDLRNQLQLAYEGNSKDFTEKLGLSRSIDEVFKTAQRVFKTWSMLPAEARKIDKLLGSLDFDFFTILDNVTIARSRKHIEKYYNTSEIGKFPERLKPVSVRPPLSDLGEKGITYKEIYEELISLHLTIYTPSSYILPSKKAKYELKEKGLTQQGRERGIQRLMSISLLKRLESSVYAFSLTLKRVKDFMTETLAVIEDFEKGNTANAELLDVEIDDNDDFDEATDIFSVGKKISIDLKDMDYKRWKHELKEDIGNLNLVKLMVDEIMPKHDTKLKALLEVIDQKQKNPINAGNKKIIIFTAFADTADYLYEKVSQYVKAIYNLETAKITGAGKGKTTMKGAGSDFNTLLTLFSPISKGKNALLPNHKENIDILIATDCISEGQNLQDCDYLINYDIHWNPVRIIQRFGRIDRIGSKNDKIQLVNFWPDISLDEYLNLERRVETRMKITVLTATGDDDLLDMSEKGDLEYRRQQLKRLQEEVVDMEDMTDGISIMDLGLNDFRMALINYMKEHPDIENAPHGMHTVVPAVAELPAGVIFILKNIHNEINRNNMNRLHPFYLVYMAEDGEQVMGHLAPKKILDTMRLLCSGEDKPLTDLYNSFNEETNGGYDMEAYSDLLSMAVESIVDTAEENKVTNFIKGKQMSFFSENISGLDDFELIGFIVVKE